MFEGWRILIVGAGTMGYSIALTFAAKGYKTTLVDRSLEQLEKARKMVRGNLNTLYEMGEITRESVENGLGLINYTDRLEQGASGANMAIEAIFESDQAKREIYARLDKLCPPDTILASNTSALNIFEIAEVSHPERLVITHWFNPPHIMPLVEIVRGPRTSDQTVQAVKELLLHLGKAPAVINQYVPGFIVNRFSGVIAREAGHMIEQGWCTWEDIDNAIINTLGLCYGFEGPLESRDYSGWDNNNKLAQELWPHLCNDKGPMPLAVELVQKGCLGVKSGRGLKDYTNVDIQHIQGTRTMNIFKMLKKIREL